MVTLRERIEYKGLYISVEPAVKKTFYLTGEDSSFDAIIENPSEQRRYSKLVFSWRLGEIRTFRIVNIEVNPSSVTKRPLTKEWLYREGTAIYELIIMQKSPEDYSTISDNDVRVEAYRHMGNIHPLSSHYVRDRDLHAYEKEYRRAMMTFSIITIVLTIFNLLLLYGRNLLTLIGFADP